MATGTEADAAMLDDGSSTRDVSGGRLLLLALVALIAAALVSMATGSTGIRLTALPQAIASALGSSSDTEHARAALVLLDLRLPRTLLAIFVGGALARGGPADVMRDDLLSIAYGCEVRLNRTPSGGVPFLLPQVSSAARGEATMLRPAVGR